MSLHGIGHVNFRAPAETIGRLRRFYLEIPGSREGHRPAFRCGSHGYWLYANGRDVLQPPSHGKSGCGCCHGFHGCPEDA